MTVEEAWAIGLFEGEGCIFVEKRCYSAVLRVKTTDFDVAKRLQKVWGGRVSKATMSPSNKKQPYNWVLQNKPVVRGILERMLPHLSMRRACKASDAIDRIDRC